MTGSRIHPSAPSRLLATPSGARLAVGVPTAAALALVALVSLAALHWWLDAEPINQLRYDLVPWGVAAACGALCVMLGGALRRLSSD